MWITSVAQLRISSLIELVGNHENLVAGECPDQLQIGRGGRRGTTRAELGVLTSIAWPGLVGLAVEGDCLLHVVSAGNSGCPLSTGWRRGATSSRSFEAGRRGDELERPGHAPRAGDTRGIRVAAGKGTTADVSLTVGGFRPQDEQLRVSSGVDEATQRSCYSSWSRSSRFSSFSAFRRALTSSAVAPMVSAALASRWPSGRSWPWVVS